MNTATATEKIFPSVGIAGTLYRTLSQVENAIGNIVQMYEEDRTNSEKRTLVKLQNLRLGMIRASGNSINWAAREVVGTKQEAWYDRTIYRVPYTGTFDASRVRAALHARIYSPSCGKFGGGSSLSSVSDNFDGTCTVETLYSIGD